MSGHRAIRFLGHGEDRGFKSRPEYHSSFSPKNLPQVSEALGKSRSMAPQMIQNDF